MEYRQQRTVASARVAMPMHLHDHSPHHPHKVIMSPFGHCASLAEHHLPSSSAMKSELPAPQPTTAPGMIFGGQLIGAIDRLNVMARQHADAARLDEAEDCLYQALNLVGCRLSMNQTHHMKGQCREPYHPEEEEDDDYEDAHSETNTSNSSMARIQKRRSTYDYDEGMDVFSELLPIDTGSDGDDGCIVVNNNSHNHATSANNDDNKKHAATLLFNLAQVRLRQNNQGEATEYLLAALDVIGCGIGSPAHPKRQHHLHLLQQDGRSCPIAIPIIHTLGYVYYRSGLLEMAISTYAEAIQYCRKDQDNLHLAATLNCLGVLYFHLPKADTTTSLDLLVNALSIQKLTLGCENSVVATTINNVGRVYYLEGQFGAALNAYNEALAIRKRVLGPDHLDLAACVYNKGQTLHQLGDLTGALAAYKEFMRIAVPKFGPAHRDVCVILKSCAMVYHECRDVDRALLLYQQALDSGREALGTHPEVASILNKMGNLYFEKGEHEKAIEMYEQGLEMECAVLDPAHPNVIVTLSNIAQIYKQRGDFAAAVNSFGEALAIQTRTLGPSDPAVAVTMSNMGLMHYQNKSFSMALDVYQEALRIRREAFGDDSLDVASTLNSIGLVLFKLGLHDMALKVFAESLKIRKAHLGLIHRDIAIVNYNIATVHMELGNDDEAMMYYQATLKVEKEALGPTHVDVVLTMQYIARCYGQRGDLFEALKCYEEILCIQRGKERLGHASSNGVADLLRTLNSIANLHLQHGNSGEVVRLMTEAYRLARESGEHVSEQDVRLSGFHLYGFSKLHPSSAAAA